MNEEEFKKLLEKDSEYINKERQRTPSPWDSLNKQLGYDKAFQAEISDGLIALDFRTIDAPSFMPVTKNRRFSSRPFQNNGIDHKNFYFEWSLGDATLIAGLKVIAWESYSLAHEAFRRTLGAIVSSMPGPQMYRAWRPCKKNIGTVCARTTNSVIFVYKNVLVNIEIDFISPENALMRISDLTDEALVPKSPNGEPWDMVFAEWVLDILKTAPRFKEFPAEPKLK